MTKEDLIPLTQRPKAEADAIRMRGGKAKGSGKRRGALVRWAKKKDPFFAFLMKAVESDDPTLAMQYYMDNFHEMEEQIAKYKKAGKPTFYMIERLLQRYNELMKFKFGEIHKNLNININTTTEEIIGRLKSAKQEFEGDRSN